MARAKKQWRERVQDFIQFESPLAQDCITSPSMNETNSISSFFLMSLCSAALLKPLQKVVLNFQLFLRSCWFFNTFLFLDFEIKILFVVIFAWLEIPQCEPLFYSSVTLSITPMLTFHKNATSSLIMLKLAVHKFCTFDCGDSSLKGYSYENNGW